MGLTMLFAAVKVIELLNRNSKKLSELVDEIPAVYNTPEIRISAMTEKSLK